MIDGFPMRIFLWTPDFRPEVESSIVPVWVKLPNLPLFMFNKHCIFSIARLIGTPLALDLPTAEVSRPSLAKVCVQIDVLKKHPQRFSLQYGELAILAIDYL